MSQRASRRHFAILVAGLIAVGLGSFLYKVLILGFPLSPNKAVRVWDVEARMAFSAGGGPVRVSLLIPGDTRRHAVVDEQFISRGYGLTAGREGPNRRTTWAIRHASGRQVLFYRATVRPTEGRRPVSPGAAPKVVVPKLSPPVEAAARVLAGQVRAQSADTETLVAALLKRLNARPPDPNARVLLGARPSEAKKMQVAVQVLAEIGIPARVAHGVQLRELERNAPVIHWLQVWYKGLWRSFDPVTGQIGVPDNYLAWWRGTAPVLKVAGGSSVDMRISVSLNRDEALQGVTARNAHLPALMGYSLFSLPIETQAVYHVLLMVPIGALILVLLRNVVGFKTFGTFMPILIALAFRDTQLVMGIILFCLMVGSGLLVRFYLERLQLLLVPRLASVLTVVVLLMAAFSVLSHKLGLHQGLSIALFPMVIMTMTIERMSIVWEERGPAEAMQQGLGSLAVASIAYAVMRVDYLRHLIFMFPELLFVILALTLLFGRYSGYRLTELRRFRVLSKGPP